MRIKLIAIFAFPIMILALMGTSQAYAQHYTPLSCFDRSERVRLLQESINKVIDVYIPPTGYYGRLTMRGVEQFQLENGIKVDGRTVDSETWNKLIIISVETQ